MGKHKKWIGYVVYSLLLTLGLLFYRFPSDALREYLQVSAGGIDPGLVLSIDKVRPSYTLGVKFMGPRISHKEILKGHVVKAESLLIRPGLWSFLKGEWKLLFEGVAYGGLIQGSAQFAEKSMAPFDLSLELKEIHIEDHEDLPGLIGRQAKGAVSGVITYNGSYDALANGTGEAHLTLSGVQVELLQPILNLKTIEFREVGIKMVLKNRRVVLSQAELKGPNMQGTLTGVVILSEELSKSSLDLNGTIEPLGDFYKTLAGSLGETKFFRQRLRGGKLSFIIQGSIAEPRINFV